MKFSGVRISCLYFLIICILLSVAFVSKIHAQQCTLTLSGRITDQDDNAPLSFATLRIKESRRTCVTDANGNYFFDSICPGNYILQIRHIDCTDTLVVLEIFSDKKQNFRLPHSAVLLRDIDVFAESKQPRLTQASEVIESDRLNQLRGGSLSDITSQVSGVSALTTGSTISKPVIHGLQGYRLLIVNNGVRLEGQQWGNEHAPEIDPYLAKKITVIKGAAGVRYGGDAIAGAIVVEPDNLPDSAGISGEFHVSGNSNGRGGTVSAILQGGLKKIPGLAWRAQGTFRKQGNIKTPRYFLSTTALEENNFSYTVGYHKKRWGTEVFYAQFNTRIGIFSGSHIGNLTDLNYAFTNDINYDTASFSYRISRPYQDVGHELMKTKFHFHTGKRSRVTINYAYQYNVRKEFDKDKSLNDSIAALNLPDLDYRIETQLGEVVWDHDNIRSFRGMAGATVMHQENVYRGRYFIPNYINNNLGAFFIERFIRQKFELETALRYDKKMLTAYLWENNVIIHPQFNFDGVSWNSGLVVKPDSLHKILFNSGFAWRAPAVNELFSDGLHHGAASIEKGDRTLKAERAWNSVLTFSRTTKNVSIECSFHANYIRDFIYQVPGSIPQLSIKGAFPVFYFRQTNALISGIDLTGRFLLTRSIEFLVNGMYLHGENLNQHQPLIFMPANRVSGKLKWNFNGRKKFLEPFVQTEVSCVARQNRVPEGLDYKSPPSAYALVGISGGGKFKWGKQEISIFAGVNNLLNARYRDYLDRFRYFCDAPGRNLFLRLSSRF